MRAYLAYFCRLPLCVLAAYMASVAWQKNFVWNVQQMSVGGVQIMMLYMNGRWRMWSPIVAHAILFCYIVQKMTRTRSHIKFRIWINFFLYLCVFLAVVDAVYMWRPYLLGFFLFKQNDKTISDYFTDITNGVWEKRKKPMHLERFFSNALRRKYEGEACKKVLPAHIIP